MKSQISSSVLGRPIVGAGVFRLVASLVLHPTLKRARRNDADEVRNCDAHQLSVLEQPISLAQRNDNPLGQLAPENFVLDLQKLKLAGNFATRPGSEIQQDRLKERFHGGPQLEASMLCHGPHCPELTNGSRTNSDKIFENCFDGNESICENIYEDSGHPVFPNTRTVP
jgi:hypothetical protein